MKKPTLDPKIITRISSLSLRAKLVVEGFLSGIHASSYKGFSTDFFHHRQYSPGDELRFIDWKIYAKSDKYVIKQFTEDTTMNAYILLDISKSMHFGETRNSIKLEYSKTLAAALAYLMIRQHDAVGFASFDTKIHSYIPPQNGEKHLNTLLESMENTTEGKNTDIYSSLLEFAKRLRRRVLIIIISDLFQTQEKAWKMITELAMHRHELILFQVLDPNELVFSPEGEIMCRDIETGEEEHVYGTDISEAYQTTINNFLKFYEVNSKKLGIEYKRFTTDKSLAHMLASYLVMRDKMR